MSHQFHAICCTTFPTNGGALKRDEDVRKTGHRCPWKAKPGLRIDSVASASLSWGFVKQISEERADRPNRAARRPPAAVRMPLRRARWVRFGWRGGSPGSPTLSFLESRTICLITESDHPILQPLQQVRLPMSRLATKTNHPVLQPTKEHRSPRNKFDNRGKSPGRQTCASVNRSASSLTTVSNQPVAKPLRMKPDEQQRRSCFSDPGRDASHPIRISTGVSSLPNGGT